IVLTVGLLVGVDGVEKMSKSKGNHIGITEPPDDMFGKVMSITDETMQLWYPLLTDREMVKSNGGTLDPLASKKALARLMVARFHGEAAAKDTSDWWDAGRPPRNVGEVEVASGPLFRIVTASGLAASANDARRKIDQGGVALDGERIANPTQVVKPGSYLL